MKKIMFNDKYGLTDAVLNGKKRMTRREPFFGEVQKPNSGFYTEGTNKGKLALCDGARIIHTSHYRMNEIVAVAQCYEKVHDYYFDFEDDDTPLLELMPYYGTKGWKNKMFVQSDFMPHRIRITGIKVERLQDISDEDCMKEGVFESNIDDNVFLVKGIYENKKRMFLTHFYTPQEAFAALIDKVSGKGTWEKNPFCFCYEFEIVK